MARAGVKAFDVAIRATWLLALRSSLAEQGWDPDWAEGDAHVLSTIAAAYPAGAVLERRLYDISNRWWAATV